MTQQKSPELQEMEQEEFDQEPSLDKLMPDLLAPENAEKVKAMFAEMLAEGEEKSATRAEDYADPQAVTEQEELEDGQYRLLKARRQSEAFAARTQGLSPSQRDTQPPTE